MDDNARFVFAAVDLPEGRRVELALPTPSEDPVVNAYAGGQPLNQYLVDWLLRFTRPGDYVMDLGCHVGTLSVPAAALGRRVLAVDASPLHVAAVRASAERNGLRELRVEWCAVAQAEGVVTFHDNGLWGVVSTSDQSTGRFMKVPAKRPDELLRMAAWPRVDLVKVDVEGSEIAGLKGLGAALQGDDAPVIVYESNGMTFELFGYSIRDIRAYLETLGYVTCRVEDGRLVYCPPDELQPEAWLDVVAIPPRRRTQERIVQSWDRDAMVARWLQWGTNEHENVRRYVHAALASGSGYPADPRVLGLREALEREFATTP